MSPSRRRRLRRIHYRPEDGRFVLEFDDGIKDDLVSILLALEMARDERERRFARAPLSDEELEFVMEYYREHKELIDEKLRHARAHVKKTAEIEEKYGSFKELLRRIVEGDEEAKRDYDEWMREAAEAGWSRPIE